MYAKVGIPTYWIINLVDGQIEVYTAPDPTASPPSYGTQTDYHPGQDVPIVLDGATLATIAVADLIP
jgi:Uma2 family endonuclease